MRIEVHPQWLHLGPDQVVGAGGAHLGELLGVSSADELDDVLRGVIQAQNLVGNLQLAGLWGGLASR
jgi:hypothetical protein